ncbi:DUF72 domain-containing protein [Hoeflea prorocentri]|uniref:DUF72 domain-containing protein n=1 Tax=Hoeflea prorocentri TaxID=1922333 RepID=A0A9X3ZHN6_9HYPH|nr:DUF72 domain-containing protein [Hoeflea prorocentri]MCY6380925.1 DUF72 domain-containing protein [Hoeflea prorocentri]MDA5398725.1 DUF72 domain-containing protein [Hoeflea prorocentri]
MTESGMIRAGIGGWTFAPWRGTFYPDDLRQKDELNYASRQLETIEINGTYYGSQKPATFAKWAADVPDGFVFSVKGNRFVTNRKVLSEGAESLERFLGSGVTELGDHLGPFLWQFAPTKKFDPDDFGAFLEMLPSSRDGIALKHAVEVRHESFGTPEFIALAARHGIAIVYADHHKYPEIADVTAPFVYARLQKGQDDIPTAYTAQDLDQWARRASLWAQGLVPDDLPYADANRPVEQQSRDVYVYFIHEGKVRAPQAAMAMQERCGTAL